MKKCVTILLFVFAWASGAAQKIQYSRQAFRPPFADAFQLLTDIDGSHHLLFFTASEKPVVFVYSTSLQLQAKTEFDVKLPENCDLRIVPFAKYYLLYLHVPGSPVHQLFWVNPQGESRNVSHVFSAAADSLWNRSTATFQLSAENDRLVLIAHTFFDALKKIGSRIVSFGDDLSVTNVRTVFFPFNKQAESLQQVQVVERDLVVLKTARHEEKGAVLDILKLRMSSGDMISNSFASGQFQYSDPAFRYNGADSTFLLYSVVREPAQSAGTQRSLFFTRLDQSLQETTPVTVLRSQLRNNVAAGFLLPAGGADSWIPLAGAGRMRATVRTKYGTRITADEVAANATVMGNAWSSQILEHNIPTAVRFTLLSDRFTHLKDSVVPNKGNFYTVQPWPSAQFTLNGKACLLLIENFSAKQHGLLLVTGTPSGNLVTKSIPVFDRYEYLLPQLRPANNKAFLLPYRYKAEMGLVKITPED